MGSIAFHIHTSSSSASFFSVFSSTANMFLDYIAPAIVSFLSLSLSDSLPHKSMQKTGIWKACLLCAISFSPDTVRHQFFSSMSSIYHSVISVRIQSQDKDHSFVSGCTQHLFPHPQATAMLTSVAVMKYSVVKQEKITPPLFTAVCGCSFYLLMPSLVS